MTAAATAWPTTTVRLSTPHCRASALLAWADPVDDPKRRLAARFLFSMLAWLEQIGVEAARAGDNIPNQLEDEETHHLVFRELAELNGGLVALPGEHTGAELLRFIAGLEGEVSRAVLNVVGEHWLATVFTWLRSGGVPYPEILDAISADEARHTHAALAAARPAPEVAASVVAQLEAHLARFAASPEWLVPIHYLVGREHAARMALACLASHRTACAHLGVAPGPAARDLEVAARAGLYGEPDPELAPQNLWQRSRPGIWPELAPLHEGRWVGVSTSDDAEIEALVAQACAAVLESQPGLNRTLRAGRVYRPEHAMIGVRRLYSRRREVFTVYTRRPHLRPRVHIAGEIARQVARARERAYEPTPDLHALEPLLPPARAAIAISQNAPWGIREGFAALGPLEGCAATIVIGAVRAAPQSADLRAWLLPEWSSTPPRWLVHLGCVFDHRVWDGPEVGFFFTALERWLEEHA